nr:P,N-U1 [Pinctada fucata]
MRDLICQALSLYLMLVYFHLNWYVSMSSFRNKDDNNDNDDDRTPDHTPSLSPPTWGVGFNPYPGDCSKYVQCWIDMGQVRGMVKQCPFGQFWDSKAITCRPSMNVDCPQGLIVDMGKGDYQWRWDIDSGWTRNLTIGGGWDAEKLLKMFRRLFAARSEYEMNEIMIEIANSPDFRALLYQLGFVPEATNALQILRILISGRGSALVQSILKQIGNVQGSEEIRRLLFNILQIEEMSNWIRDHTGKHHGHALQNWRKLINSLKLKDNDWNKGLLLRMILDNEINGGTIESRAKLIADLWRKFVTENGMDTAEWRQNLIFTFTDDSANHGVNGYINVNLMDEIQKVLQGNGPVKNRWDDFLNKRNITVSWYQGPTGNKIITAKIIQDWLNWLTGNGNGGIDMTGGLGPYAGFTQSGIRNVADLWRRFVTDMDLDKDASLASLLRWTFTSDNHIPSPHNNLLLVNEMKNILADDNLRHKWLKFLENRDLTITDTPSGWEVVNGADTTKLANWLYWLFSSVSDHVTNDNGGLTESGIGHMADIWRTFITDMHLDQDSSLQPLLEWTFSGKGIQTPQDKELLITEIKKVLQHPNVRRMWLDFLNSRDINIVATGNGFDVVKGGTHNDAESWISWLITSHGKNGQGQGGFLDFIENGNNGAILDQIIGSWNMHGSAWGSGIATPIHLDMDGFGSWMDSDLFGAMLIAGGGGAHSADTSIESLDHILGSLSTGHGTNSGSSYYDSAEYHYNNYNNYGGGVTDYTGGLGLWALRDADINGFGSSEELVRKRREAKRSRSKRQALPTKFNYMSLLGNCGSQKPSIDISANERNVRMSLMTQGSGAPTTLEIPIVPSWNKLTLVYDGNKMTGTVENWRGKQRKEAALSGMMSALCIRITDIFHSDELRTVE